MCFPVLPSLRLKPFTSYQFRVKATNDIGDSEYSEESEAITTLQDGKCDIRKTPLFTGWIFDEFVFLGGCEAKPAGQFSVKSGHLFNRPQPVLLCVQQCFFVGGCLTTSQCHFHWEIVLHELISTSPKSFSFEMFQVYLVCTNTVCSFLQLWS